MKFLHFLPKPPMPVMTRAERLQEREQFKRDIGFAKVYGGFLVSMFLLISIVSTFSEKPDSPETIHKEICQHAPNSPLCNDFALLERVDTIASKKNVPTRLVV